MKLRADEVHASWKGYASKACLAPEGCVLKMRALSERRDSKPGIPTKLGAAELSPLSKYRPVALDYIAKDGILKTYLSKLSAAKISVVPEDKSGEVAVGFKHMVGEIYFCILEP